MSTHIIIVWEGEIHMMNLCRCAAVDKFDDFDLWLGWRIICRFRFHRKKHLEPKLGHYWITDNYKKNTKQQNQPSATDWQTTTKLKTKKFQIGISKCRTTNTLWKLNFQIVKRSTTKPQPRSENDDLIVHGIVISNPKHFVVQKI